MEQQKKPDLTNFKNIFNYVVYGLAAVVSVLYLKSGTKDDKIVESLEQSIKDCNDEKKGYIKNNQRLIDKAYNLEQISREKDTMLVKSAEAFDSIAVRNLKEQTDPYIKKIKQYTK